MIKIIPSNTITLLKSSNNQKNLKSTKNNINKGILYRGTKTKKIKY